MLPLFDENAPLAAFKDSSAKKAAAGNSLPGTGGASALAPPPLRFQTVAALRAHAGDLRRAGRRIALVPTMGALHAGHLSLVREGLSRADEVIVSIFVNPAQFAPHEDFAAYPRPLEADIEKLAQAGVQAVFTPAPEEIYPKGFATSVQVGGVTEPLEGAFRPGHFSGVATVVAKLLLMSQADIALFGEKDYQQLQLVKRLVTDLNIPTEIVPVPTLRDENGLALSSRNAYLSGSEYQTAIKLNKIMAVAAQAARAGGEAEALCAVARETLIAAGFGKVDYLEIRDAETLAKISGTVTPGTARILAALWLGKTRLIDNMPV